MHFPFWSDIYMQPCSRWRNELYLTNRQLTAAWCTLEGNHGRTPLSTNHKCTAIWKEIWWQYERKYDGNMKWNVDVDGNIKRNIKGRRLPFHIFSDSAVATKLLGYIIMIVFKEIWQDVLFNGIPRQSCLLFRYMSARSAAYWIFKYRKMYSDIQSGCQVLLDFKLKM